MNTEPPPKQAVIHVDDIASIVSKLFRELSYRGDDGRTLWKAAAAVLAGRISEDELWDAAKSTADAKPDNPPSYFYTALASNLKRRGANLCEQLRLVQIEPTWPCSAPEGREPVRQLPATWQNPMPWQARVS